MGRGTEHETNSVDWKRESEAENRSSEVETRKGRDTGDKSGENEVKEEIGAAKWREDIEAREKKCRGEKKVKETNTQRATSNQLPPPLPSLASLQKPQPTSSTSSLTSITSTNFLHLLSHLNNL
ncbi:hypothetical protein Pmani_034227 [Petrolisthes manimaculis]|uniref:Uncharacterized protein n=1 Tax=Petrolisthes manimaculis TaxID=1843537 RepID=A0AAE1TPC8_9EUCA|nr:hypothetical protein Pmani_034227 [Petrolisthes manimaculis]